MTDEPTLKDVRRAKLTEYSQSKAVAVLLARRRRLTVTDGRVAASLALYESALERAKR